MTRKKLPRLSGLARSGIPPAKTVTVPRGMLKSSEACARYGVTPATLKQWRDAGLRYEFRGRKVLIAKADIERWIDERANGRKDVARHKPAAGIESENEITEAEFKKHAQVLRARFVAHFGPRCTAFVARMPDGTAKQFGSGVLLQIADAYFVLTAAHIFEATSAQKLRVGLMSGMEDNPILWLDDVNAKAQVLKTSKLDIGIINLSSELASRMRKIGRIFSPLIDAEPNDQTSQLDRKAWYLALGFPSANQKLVENGKVIYTRSQFYCTTSVAPNAKELETISEFDPKVHVAIDYNKAHARCYTGDKGSLPDPAGMSGCGVWRIGNDFQDFCTAELSTAKLVGVETGWYPKYSIMKATKLGIAIAVIHQNFPELRKPIELNFPLPTSLVHPVTFKPL